MRRSLFLGLICLSAFGWSQDRAHPVGFRKDIDAFLAADKRAAPPADGILFIGSSIFRGWTELKSQMAPMPVYNRAFGGSRTWEVNAYFDEIVKLYKPRVIVYYCGSNDVNSGETAVEIAMRSEFFMERVAKELPGTKVIYTSVLKAPQKKAKWDIVDAINSRMEKYCATHPGRVYVDLNLAVFDAKGAPLEDLYVEDKLHYKPAAYVAFAKILKPILTKVLATKP